MNGSQNELKINFLALGVASSCPFFVYMGSPYICPQKQNSMAIENGLMRFIAEMCVWNMPLRAYIEGGPAHMSRETPRCVQRRCLLGRMSRLACAHLKGQSVVLSVQKSRRCVSKRGVIMEALYRTVI